MSYIKKLDCFTESQKKRVREYHEDIYWRTINKMTNEFSDCLRRHLQKEFFDFKQGIDRKYEEYYESKLHYSLIAMLVSTLNEV